MTQTQSAPSGFDFLIKAGLVLMAFQIAVAASMILKNGLEGSPNGFFILLMSTGLFAGSQRRLAASRISSGAVGWIVAMRAAALLMLAIGTLAMTFHRFLPDAAPDLIVQTVFSLMWVVIALKGAALGKLKPNRYLGLCVYWTKHSRLAWEKAHRVMGRILFWGGLAGLAASFTVPPMTSLALWVAVIAFGVLTGLYVSWRAWREDPERS